MTLKYGIVLKKFASVVLYFKIYFSLSSPPQFKGTEIGKIYFLGHRVGEVIWDRS